MSDMRASFCRSAADLVERDERVALILADISTQYFDAALRRHPTRVINIGIMEQAMVGVAAGFAMEGFHPIAHSLSPFMAERPYEQLKLDFGYQALGGTFVGAGGSYDYAAEGATHHSPADATLMLAIPRMQVLIPGHAGEVEQLLRATYDNGRPTYLRTSVASNDEALDVEPGRIEVARRGRGATVLAFGPMLDRTLAACAGLDVTVAYSTSLEPFDHEGLRAIAGPSPDVVAIEPFYQGTSASVLTETFRGSAARLAFVGVARAFIHTYGTPAEIDVDLGLDAPGIRARLAEHSA
ncbi:MAG TPA: transketolase [Actinomycetota bacterium]|nr:transketolase [Actinomycetota bacterium]